MMRVWVRAKQRRYQMLKYVLWKRVGIVPGRSRALSLQIADDDDCTKRGAKASKQASEQAATMSRWQLFQATPQHTRH